jgi:hypothetical protein
LSEIAIFAIHCAVYAHFCQRRNEFVTVAILINGTATGGGFLFQTVEKAGQAVFNVVRLLSHDSQIAKPSLMQTANVIEIHYVFEDEAPTRLHVVPENQVCLQGPAIIAR